jgi:hypothetical protein
VTRVGDREPRVGGRGEQALIVGYERGQVPLQRERGGQVDGVRRTEGLRRQRGRVVEHVGGQRDPRDALEQAVAARQRARLGAPDRPRYLGAVQRAGDQGLAGSLRQPPGQRGRFGLGQGQFD